MKNEQFNELGIQSAEVGDRNHLEKNRDSYIRSLITSPRNFNELYDNLMSLYRVEEENNNNAGSFGALSNSFATAVKQVGSLMDEINRRSLDNEKMEDIVDSIIKRGVTTNMGVITTNYGLLLKVEALLASLVVQQNGETDVQL